MRNDFAVFILTNSRPNRVKTYKTLRDGGYTGKIFLVLDDLDKTIDEYRENFPEEEIIVYDKMEIYNRTDTADNSGNHKVILFSRNVCFEIAHKMGLKYFLELDDDYHRFDFRCDDNYNYCEKKIKNLNIIFDIFLEFLEETPTKSIAFSQNGDFIGGKNGKYGKSLFLSRKCMNSFFCSTEKPFQFVGLFNEDVNCYTSTASKGNLFFTSSHVSLKQTDTQSNSGGMTDLYLEMGTYRKSFYSVIFHPSSVTVEEMQTANSRLHHRVNWDLTCPKIIREEHRKEVENV